MLRPNTSMTVNDQAPGMRPRLKEKEVEASNRFGPYKRVHRLMRGRYYLLLPAMAATMVLGGLKGWRSQAPIYRSEGLIHVANSLPTVMNSTDQNQPMQMYEEFVASQVLLIESRHVVTLASENPGFKAVAGAMSVEDFATELMVDHPPRTQAIHVTFTSRNPDIAAAAVKAVIGAFLDSYGKSDTTDEQRRLQVLTDRKTSLAQQLTELKRHVETVKPPSTTSIAIIDDLMRELYKQQATLAAQVTALQGAGYGLGYPALASTRARLLELQNQIDDYQKKFAALQVASASSPPSDRRVTILAEFLPYVQQMDALRTELEETDHRIDTLQTEASLGAERFRVLSSGEVPSAPYADRRVRMAAIYGLGASLIPFGLFLAIALLNRRLRFSEDAHEVLSETPLLGVLPMLPHRNTDPDLANIASYCIHNLRIRLQLLIPARSGGTFMITSAAQGEGKSSLTLALGLSFASLGKRVLMIDSDLIGRGLTHHLGHEGGAGLTESLDRHKLVPVEVISKNLALLPVGQVSTGREQFGFTADEISDIVLEAAANFDIVLIDAGPALGTLHTPVVAQVVDHVILTIASGQRQVLVRRSIQTLQSVGSRVSGFVFNRAREEDYRRWVGGDSYYSAASKSAARERAIASLQNGSGSYGPLAASVTPRATAFANGGES